MRRSFRLLLAVFLALCILLVLLGAGRFVTWLSSLDRNDAIAVLLGLGLLLGVTMLYVQLGESEKESAGDPSKADHK